MKTISTKLAASDLIKKIEEKLFLYKIFLTIMFFAIIFNWIGLLTHWFAIALIIMAWYYHKDIKEIKRLEDTYGL